MAFVLSFITLLALFSSASSGPHRVPKCIEDANPFENPCFDDIEAQAEGVSLENREQSTTPTFHTIQFTDTFTHTKTTSSSGNSTVLFPDYPQGLALSYPGFAYSSVKSSELLMPSPPQVLITDPSIQNMAGRQPGIIRQTNTSSFDLRSIRFACAYISAAGQMTIPSCLATFTCAPKTMNNTGIPSGHRPTPRPMVSSTFEFVPNLDHSSLTWPNLTSRDITEETTIKATLYADAELGGDFYDLDHCHIMLQQYSSMSGISDIIPAVLIDDVVGVAYYDD